MVVMGNGAAGQAGAMGADTSTGQLNVASLQVWQGGCPGQGAAAAQRKEEAPSAPLARNAGAEALTAGSGGCGTTPPPAFHDPRSLAALHSSSRGRHGQWACGHAAGPAPPPPPKPHTTPIPEHLLRATSLVLRTNRPEPDPVSARRLKMTLPKTPMLATAQRLGSHPSMRRQVGQRSGRWGGASRPRVGRVRQGLQVRGVWRAERSSGVGGGRDARLCLCVPGQGWSTPLAASVVCVFVCVSAALLSPAYGGADGFV